MNCNVKITAEGTADGLEVSIHGGSVGMMTAAELMPCPIHPSQRWKVCLTKTGPPRCSLARWVLICGCSKEVVRRPDPPSVGKPVRFRPPVQEL